MSYNSYFIDDEKTVLIDTVEKSCAEQFYQNTEFVLKGRELDYLIVQHMVQRMVLFKFQVLNSSDTMHKQQTKQILAILVRIFCLVLLIFNFRYSFFF